MPYNYTVSTFNFTEALQDAAYAGNMITGGSITITPNSGYVVSASGFTVAGSLPPQFASISFTDTAVAGEVNNTVTVTFVFSALFEMSSAANNINIPISGHAVLVDAKRIITFDIDLIDNTTENVNGSTAVSGTYDAGTTGSPIEITNVLSANVAGNPGIDANNNITIATIILTADANNHFNNAATITVENAPAGANFILQLVETSGTNSDGQSTTIKYSLKLNSEVSIPNGLGCKVFIHYTGVSDRTTLTTSKKEIKQIIYGSPEIPIGGATKRIQIVGDVGAEFDLTITKASNNTSIMSTTLANADIIHIPAGLIRGLNKTLTTTDTNQLLASFEFEQIFPSASVNEIYHINVTPKGSTILNANLTQTAPQGIIYQYINPTVVFNTDAGTDYTVTSKTALSIIGRPNKKPGRLKHIKTIKEIYSFTYVYTKGHGTTKFTTANVPTWSMTDTSSNWDQSSTDHGNIVEIINIALSKDDETTPTVITVTGDIIIKKFGTANVTFNLDSSDFLSVDSAALTTP
tara:strand:+ start:8377 stop:9942 length:1566 start_codon:yes stop_codon:yes gene_type:complete